MNIKLSEIDKALGKIKALKKSIEQMDNVIKKVAEKGYNVARDGFSTAIYDGNNDVVVNLEKISNGYRINAIGDAVLFIEFGTGISYPSTHPEALAMGMTRGGYGKGRGNNPEWYYYGSQGTNGEYVKTDEAKGDLFITRGNPANMPMYKAYETMLNDIVQSIKEVIHD